MVVSENEPSFDKDKDHYSSKMIMFVGLSVRKLGTNNGHYLKRRKKKRTKINKSYPKEFRCLKEKLGKCLTSDRRREGGNNAASAATAARHRVR